MSSILMVIGGLFIAIAIVWFIGQRVISATLGKGNSKSGKDTVYQSKSISGKGPQIVFVVIGVLIIVASQSFTVIPTGFTGVRTTFGQVDNLSVPNGINVKIPFVQSIEMVNNKKTDLSFATGEQKIWGETSEKVPVYFNDITVTQQINPDKSAWIFANVNEYDKTLVTSSLVVSALKNSVVQLSSVDATIRDKIEPLARENLQKALDEKYSKDTVMITKIVIGGMDFEDSYNAAIAQKNEAELAQSEAAIRNKTNIEKAEADAKVKLTEAETERKANELKERSITDKILLQEYISKWDGEMPLVVGSDGGIMLDLGKLMDQIEGSTNADATKVPDKK